MNGIDPKWVFWLGILVTIETAIGQGTVQLTNLVAAQWIPTITGWCTLLSFVGNVVMTGLAGYSSRTAGPLVKAVVLLAVILGGLFAFSGDARAQVKSIGQIQRDIDAKFQQTQQRVTAAVTPAPAPEATLPCDFKMFIRLSPDNLVATMKQCVAQANGKLIADAGNALTSAQNHKPNPDADGVNCLTPGLAILKAGAFTPMVPAVTAPDGTITTPEVPAQEPGLITLFQKYREFTIDGGLTACQTWINGPVQLTIAAGLNATVTGLAGAALLAPK